MKVFTLFFIIIFLQGCLFPGDYKCDSLTGWCGKRSKPSLLGGWYIKEPSKYSHKIYENKV